MFTNNQLFAAPLAGITDKPFRRIIREFSPDVGIVTEMISCHSLVEQHKNCPRNFDSYFDEGNIGTQIFGADVYLMAESAKILQDAGAKWIDINMGCPVPKVATRAGAGAYLMRDHALAEKIMMAVVKSVEIPVSIKTRLGWDNDTINWNEMIRIATDCGISWCVLHGRTRSAGYIGNAVHPDVHGIHIPMIANGDIKKNSDLDEIEKLGYSGAMIGRACLGCPWIFRKLENDDFLPENIGKIVLKHLAYTTEYYGERIGIPLFRKHVAWYSAGLPNSSDFRVKINQITGEKELKSEICKFWGCVDKI